MTRILILAAFLLSNVATWRWTTWQHECEIVRRGYGHRVTTWWGGYVVRWRTKSDVGSWAE
jgi:hypothetical protein